MESILNFFKPEVKKQLLIGTYLFPYVLFDGFDYDDPFSAIEIIEEVFVDNEKILITRNGGLFVKPNEDFSDALISQSFTENDINEKLQFEDKFVKYANRVVCEFCVSEIVTEPVTQVHVSRASLIDNHALITQGSGGRESYYYRTVDPYNQVLTGKWITNRIVPIEKLSKVSKLSCTSRLLNVSSALPDFIASAYYNFSTQNLSESMLSSWIVVEQIIDYLWGEYVRELQNSKREKRLRDTRTYSSAVRIEVLFMSGELSNQEYEMFQKARKSRNDLAHRALISHDCAYEGMNAMKLAIEHVVNAVIAEPATSRGISW